MHVMTTSTPRQRVFFCCAALAFLRIGAAAETQPAPLPWGTGKAGVQISLSVPGPVRAGGKFQVRVAIRNVGSAPVALPGTKDVFGWLLLLYSRDNAYVTGKAFPAAELELGKWPGKLAGGKTIRFKPADLSGLNVYSYDKRRKVYTAYLKPDSGATLPAPDGTLARKLAPAKARARFMLYLPRPGERPLVLSSNVVDLEIAPPDWAQLSADAQKAFAARLLKQFDKDAWAAMSAHGQAVGIGPPIVPYLIQAVRQRNRPGFSRLWLATALADIRCDESADELIRLLDDPSGGIRSVVGYHGPKQRSAKLDAAVIKKIAKEKDTGPVSYALLGFMVFRNRVPEELLAASFDSKDPRVRATFAAALKGRASDFNVSRLAALLADENERVRSAAAKALGAMNRPSPPLIAALVRSLPAPGEAARKSIADALGQLTGRKAPYDPKAAPEARQKVIQGWRTWWAENAAKTRKP